MDKNFLEGFKNAKDIYKEEVVEKKKVQKKLSSYFLPANPVAKIDTSMRTTLKPLSKRPPPKRSSVLHPILILINILNLAPKKR